MSGFRDFHIGDVLSVAQDVLVSPALMAGVRELLNYMTRDDLYTHQLRRAQVECRPWLVRQYPWLGALDCEEMERAIAAARTDQARIDVVVDAWVVSVATRFNEGRMTLRIETIPLDDHDVIDPVEELRAIRPDLPVIVVNGPNFGPKSEGGE